MFTDILQPTHLLFILVIALLVLGPKRLPEAGRALGRGLRDFKNALNTDEIRDHMVSTATETTTWSDPEPATSTDTPVDPSTPAGATSATEPNPAADPSPEPDAASPAPTLNRAP